MADRYTQYTAWVWSSILDSNKVIQSQNYSQKYLILRNITDRSSTVLHHSMLQLFLLLFFAWCPILHADCSYLLHYLIWFISTKKNIGSRSMDLHFFFGLGSVNSHYWVIAQGFIIISSHISINTTAHYLLFRWSSAK